MTLAKLIQDNPYVLDTRGNLNVEIESITLDSRERVSSGLFFCITGSRVDSHSFAPQAIQSGCIALMVEHFLEIDVPQIMVSNGRAAMARTAASFYGHPAKSLKLLGITGTKGKTTTSYLLKSICEKAGYACGLIGTIGNMIGKRMLEGTLTTPDPIDLHRTLRQMVDQGIQTVVIEVSAHAMDMHRLDGLEFDVGCFTNFSQDHLDYFHDMENYFHAKCAFFQHGMVRNAAVNADDQRRDEILQCIRESKLEEESRPQGKRPITHMLYGIANPSDVFARNIMHLMGGVGFHLHLSSEESIPVQLQLGGVFNVSNALAAASCALLMGIGAETIQEGLEAVEHVPGRMEVLPIHQPFSVILDYAHSPDSLENILTTARELAKKRVIVVFGCGGDRDHQKRPIMGEIAGRKADISILTSDNPRHEDPMEILRAIEEGIRRTDGAYEVIEHRKDAIRRALSIGAAGDVIVLAGKGHEKYQDIKGVKHPFDEKQMVDDLLQELNT